MQFYEGVGDGNVVALKPGCTHVFLVVLHPPTCFCTLEPLRVLSGATNPAPHAVAMPQYLKGPQTVMIHTVTERSETSRILAPLLGLKIEQRVLTTWQDKQYRAAR